MTIVTPAPAPASEAELSVVVLRPRDAAHAAEGGADALLLSAAPEEGHLSPDPATVSAVLRETDLPLWVALRGREAGAHAEERLEAMVDLGARFVELGAAGLAYGALDRDLEVDREACHELEAELGVPWLFHGFDEALDTDRAWRDAVDLPHLAGVVTAGSTRGLAHGSEELIQRCRHDARVAALTVAGGGLTPDLVPWLVRAGVRRFAVGSAVREGRSWTRGSVGVDHVRSWRMLLDDALARALGIPVD